MAGRIKWQKEPKNKDENDLDQKDNTKFMTGIIILAIVCLIIATATTIAYFATLKENKALKQQTGNEYNLSGSLTVKSSDSQRIQVIYNGTTYMPKRIQIKEGIIFWQDGNRTICADRSQVQIYIMTLTTSA